MAEPLRLSFNLPFADAIAAAAARKVVLPREYYSEVPAQARRLATTISGLSALDQVQAVIDSYRTAAAKGVSLEEWKREALTRNWGLSRSRLETIFRTNIQTEYSAGHWRSFQEHKARRPYLMWSAINDSRVRPAHLAMDGYIAPLDDPIWQVWHPPAGYNCRCSQISLTREQATARGVGRRDVPAVQPDPGFGGGQPGDPGTNIARVEQQKLDQAAPAVREAYAEATKAEPIGPRGRPISEALGMPSRGATAREMREALDIIDSLHGDGRLERMPALVVDDTDVLGYYRQKMTGVPLDVAVSTIGDHPRLTFAHEVGHWLDHAGWGDPRSFSSETHVAAQAWREVVTGSPSAQQLLRFLETTTDGEERKWLRYALAPRELWARSYAQWVATRSGDATMLTQVGAIRGSTFSRAYRLSQWDALEFEPIGKAIDELFAILGWRF